LDFFSAGEQDGRIAGATWRNSGRDLSAGNFACSVDYFAHSVAIAATAKIVYRAALVEDSKREDVRARQIDDVDVIAYARAVACGIVLAVNLNIGAEAGRGVQHQWNQMRLRIMPFAV